MTEKRKVKFECRECGSHELGYQKYVKCITPVTIQEDVHMEYGSSLFDEDDYLIAENTFICMNCKGYVEYCGFRMETEKDLVDYLKMDPDVREQQQKEYEEHLKSVIDADEQEKWQLDDLEEISAAENLAQTN